MTSAYEIPTAPEDPVAAALELVVRLPELYSAQVAAHVGPAVDRESIQKFARQLGRVLGHLASRLEAERVFDGLSWPDARLVAETVCTYYSNHDNPGERVAEHALATATGTDGIVWRDRRRAGKALQRASVAVALAAPAALIGDMVGRGRE